MTKASRNLLSVLASYPTHNHARPRPSHRFSMSQLWYYFSLSSSEVGLYACYYLYAHKHTIHIQDPQLPTWVVFPYYAPEEHKAPKGNRVSLEFQDCSFTVISFLNLVTQMPQKSLLQNLPMDNRRSKGSSRTGLSTLLFLCVSI